MKKKLPESRAGITREVEILGQGITCPNCKQVIDDGKKTTRLTSGEYKDGTLGEFEIKVGKPGQELRIYDVISAFGSMALQHGVPPEKVISHMMFIDTESGGVVKGDDFRICKSILDWVGKRLKKDYLR